MRTVFFGTPEFAVPSLRALLGEGFDVAGVVTQPDKPQGRSRSSLIAPPVKTVALEEGLEVIQPDRPASPEFQETLRSMKPDLGVVIAYGHILPATLLSIPRLGMINVHASLLPKLRGAAPIQHALMQGMDETGISIMQLDQGMDTGPVRLSVATRIFSDETAGELTARLSELGALALIEAMELMGAGSLDTEPQNHAEATYAPKITRDVARIAWDAPPEHVARLVRSLDPKPGAWTTLNGKEVKLFGPRVREVNGKSEAPGTVMDTEPFLAIATAGGVVEFSEVQPTGSTRKPVAEWIRGRGVSTGQRFE